MMTELLRTATNTLFATNVTNMMSLTDKLAVLTAQVSSGKSVTSPADNAIAAAQAVQVQAASDANTQYINNQKIASAQLQQEDHVLGSVTTTLQSIQTLILQAGNPTLSNQNRTALAAQLQAARAQLFGLANTTDTTGNSIFAGYQTNKSAFTNNANGIGAVYNGDAGVRLAQINSSIQVAISDPGHTVFTSVQPGAANNIATATNTNTGSAVIQQLTVTNPQASDLADNYTINFQVAGSNPVVTTYTITDNTTSQTSQPQPYTPETPISLGTNNGQALVLTGNPANGDSFTISPPTTQQTNIFNTLDSLIKTLNQAADTSQAKTGLSNSLVTLGTQVANTLNNVITVRSFVGAREQQVITLSNAAQALATNYATQLSDLTSADVISAYTQFTQAQNTLQAAQKAFVAVQGLSLFALINP